MEIMDDEDPPPRLLGFCRGIPGVFHGRRLYDSDIDVNLLEHGEGMICDSCCDKLLAGRSWSSASPVLNEANKGRGSGIVLPGSTVFKRHLTAGPRMQGRPQGTARSRKKTGIGADYK